MPEAPAQQSAETSKVDLEAFGVRVTVEVSDEALFDPVRDVLPYEAGLTAGDGARSLVVENSGRERALRFRLTSDDRGVFRVLQAMDEQRMTEILACADLELALSVLGSAVHESVAFRATTAVFVNGAAALLNGRAIVILGPALSGRSTLLDALVHAGASRWSDQYVVLDETGRAMQLGAARPKRLDQLAEAPPDSMSAVSIGAVVATTYRPGASWSPAEGTAGDAMLSVLAHAVPIRDHAARTMSVVRRATADAVMLQSDRGEAEDAATALVERLQDPCVAADNELN